MAGGAAGVSGLPAPVNVLNCCQCHCIMVAGGAVHGRRGGGAGRAMQQLQGRGGGANSNSGIMTEKAAWMALIDDLKKRCAAPCVWGWSALMAV